MGDLAENAVLLTVAILLIPLSPWVLYLLVREMAAKPAG